MILLVFRGIPDKLPPLESQSRDLRLKDQMPPEVRPHAKCDTWATNHRLGVTEPEVKE